MRLALVLVWLIALALAWWAAPRERSYEQAREDIADGRVSAYQWGDRWHVGLAQPWFGAADLASSGTHGPLFVWRTAEGRVYWTNTDNFGQVTLTGSVDQQSYSGPGAVGIEQELRAAGLEHRAGGIRPVGLLVTGLGLALAAIFLGVVVAGPTPVVGTRWFWFWLVCTAPYGLGLLYWLGRDRPWSRPAAPASVPGRPEWRDRGTLGVGLGILATILVSVLVLALHDVFGDRWVPLPDVQATYGHVGRTPVDRLSGDRIE
ncbi:hypothetical protein ABGB07_27980 [Micromonosporaceae bacterium B7E4]